MLKLQNTQSKFRTLIQGQIKIGLVLSNKNSRHDLQTFLQLIRDVEMALVADLSDSIIKTLRKKTVDVLIIDIYFFRNHDFMLISEIKRKFDLKLAVLGPVPEKDIVKQMVANGLDAYLQDTDFFEIIKGVRDLQSRDYYFSEPVLSRLISSIKTESTKILSQRELQILNQMATGKTYKRIAEELNISAYTVRTHIKNIFKKLEVNNKGSAVEIAKNHNWI